MSLVSELRTVLINNPGVSDIVSTRIFVDAIDQDTDMPAIVLSLVGGTQEYHFGGESSLREVRVQIDCQADSAAEAHDLAEAVRNAISGRSGYWGNIQVRFVRLDPPVSGIIPPSDFRGMGTFVLTVDATIHHHGEKPTLV